MALASCRESNEFVKVYTGGAVDKIKLGKIRNEAIFSKSKSKILRHIRNIDIMVARGTVNLKEIFLNARLPT